MKPRWYERFIGPVVGFWNHRIRCICSCHKYPWETWEQQSIRACRARGFCDRLKGSECALCPKDNTRRR